MRNSAALLVAGLLVIAACSSDESMEMDMANMNMGDAEATPAADVPGADVATGRFVLLSTRPDGYDAATGEAWLARHDAGTTATIELAGLAPGVDYIAHLHVSTCADAGGDHFRFDPDGSGMPPNEIHLAFTGAADGSGFMTAENAETVGPEARSIVVHPVEDLDAKIACADLSG